MFGIKLNFATIAQLGLAAMTGGTSLLATTALKTIGSQIAMSLIQKLGEQMGLPPSMINLAQAAFASASGQPGLVKQNIAEAVRDLVGELDLRPSEAGQLQRELMSASDKSMGNLMEIVGKSKKKAASASEEEEGGSWLVALARAMGKVLDNKAAQMKEQSKEVSKYANMEVKKDSKGGLTEDSQENQNKLSSASTLLQAYGQEMSFISNAATNVLKSMGEAQATLARK
jgi:hypothetical protein